MNKASMIFSLISLIIAVVTMVGWHVHHSFLTALLPEAVGMRYNAALAVVLMSIHILTYAINIPERVYNHWLSITNTCLPVFAVAILLSSAWTGDSVVVDPSHHGVPSVGLIAAVIMLSWYMLFIHGSDKYQPIIGRIVSTHVAALGVMALLGYIFDAPLLYYDIPGASTPIAPNAAMCLIFLGAACWQVCKNTQLREKDLANGTNHSI